MPFMHRPRRVVGRDQVMKFIVPIALSLVATLLAVVVTRLVVRSRARFDLDDLPGIA